MKAGTAAMDMKVRKATEKKSTDILSWIDCGRDLCVGDE